MAHSLTVPMVFSHPKFQQIIADITTLGSMETPSGGFNDRLSFVP
jgi:hypothetical protein